MRVKIETPVPDYSGNVGNLPINDGVGYADSEVHAAEIGYCRANGYTVTDAEPLEPIESDSDLDSQQADELDAADSGKPPRRNGSAEAWRAYALTQGLDAEEAESLTRDQLVELLTSNEETES